MNLNPFHKPTPQTLKDRAEGVAKDGVEIVRTTRDEAVSLARRGERLLSSSRSRALAAVGAATGAAAGFAFWRSRKEDEGPSVHHDPAQSAAPVKATPPQPPTGSSEASGSDGEPKTTPSPGSSGRKPKSKKPVTDTKAAASNAAGTRSK